MGQGGLKDVISKKFPLPNSWQFKWAIFGVSAWINGLFPKLAQDLHGI
jgi:hypothetical protein